MEYTFTLKYRLGENGDDPQALVESLGAAGCDDTPVGTGRPGHLALAFARKAPTAEDAMLSAMADVARAIPSARMTAVCGIGQRPV